MPADEDRQTKWTLGEGTMGRAASRLSAWSKEPPLGKPELGPLLYAKEQPSPFSGALLGIRVAVALSFITLIGRSVLKQAPPMMTPPLMLGGFAVALAYMGSAFRWWQIRERARDRSASLARAHTEVMGDLVFCSAFYLLTNNVESAAFVFFLTPIIVVAHEWRHLRLVPWILAVVGTYLATAALMVAGGAYFAGMPDNRLTPRLLVSITLFFVPRVGFFALLAYIIGRYAVLLHSRVELSEGMLTAIRSGIAVLGERGELLYANPTQAKNVRKCREGLLCFHAFHDAGQQTECWWCRKQAVLGSSSGEWCITNAILEPPLAQGSADEIHFYQVQFGTMSWDERRLIVESIMDVTEAVLELGLPAHDGADSAGQAYECPVPIAVVDVRQETWGRVLYANRAKRRLSPRAELGKLCYDCFPHTPRGAECDGCPVRLVTQSGQPEKGITHSDEPGGHRRSSMVTCVPIRNSRGEVHAALEIIDDITDRVALTGLATSVAVCENEAAIYDGILVGFMRMLRVQRCSLLRLGSSATEAIVDRVLRGGPDQDPVTDGRELNFGDSNLMPLVTNSTGNVLVVNDVQDPQTGSAAPRPKHHVVTGMDCADLREVSVQNSVSHMLLAPIAVQGQVWAVITAETTNSDRAFTSEDADVALSAAGVAGAVLSLWFERRDREAALRHQLRGWPARVRQGIFELKDCLAPGQPEGVQAALELLEWSAQQTAAVMDTLISASDIEQGRLMLTLHKVDPWALIQEQVCQAQPEAQAKRTDLSCHRDPMLGGISVMADREKLSLAVHHLILNALDATGRRAEATVRVRLGATPSAYVIAVEDNGPGIANEHRDRIFERGFSSHGSTGTGLYVCRGIARAHGWDLEYSVGARGGATFALVIPKDGRN